MRSALLLALLALNGCILFRSDPTGCQAVADRDPAVRDFEAKNASFTAYIRNHEDDYKEARRLAVLKCERERGIIPQGGGVQPVRVPR